MKINAEDVNNFAPEWKNAEETNQIVVEVISNIGHEDIVTLEATDKDCSKKTGSICSYELDNEEQPFAISNEGNQSIKFRKIN